MLERMEKTKPKGEIMLFTISFISFFFALFEFSAPSTIVALILFYSIPVLFTGSFAVDNGYHLRSRIIFGLFSGSLAVGDHLGTSRGNSYHDYF